MPRDAAKADYALESSHCLIASPVGQLAEFIPYFARLAFEDLGEFDLTLFLWFLHVLIDGFIGKQIVVVRPGRRVEHVANASPVSRGVTHRTAFTAGVHHTAGQIPGPQFLAGCSDRAVRRDSLLAEIAADPDPLVICFVVRQAGCLRWSTADPSTPVASHQEPMIQISRSIKHND